jgi:molybdopterin molybdotransferase
MKRIIDIAHAIEGYDPDALHVDKARAAIRACLAPVRETERVPVRAALGRVLAEDIVPTIDVPGHDNSAMDGYAVRAADLSGGEAVLEEVGAALAGRKFEGRLAPGQCVRIMTGAAMPAGTDTVVMQEHVSRDGDQVRIAAGHRAGQNVRQAGEDLRVGQVMLAAGTRLLPAALGMLASVGIGQVQVRRRPKVAFFSTGDELRSLGEPLQPGQVYDSNRYTLRGMLARAGVEFIDLGVVRDDPARLGEAIDAACAVADVVLTSGGVSTGDADYVKGILEQRGQVGFWRIAIRPGRPLAFGRLGRAVFFGLPGNPVAVMMTFYQFVREALLVLGGRAGDCAALTLEARAAEPMRKVPGRTEYQRGVLFRENGALQVKTTGQQGSGVLRSMSEANCFIVREGAAGPWSIAARRNAVHPPEDVLARGSKRRIRRMRAPPLRDLHAAGAPRWRRRCCSMS